LQEIVIYDIITTHTSSLCAICKSCDVCKFNISYDFSISL